MYRSAQRIRAAEGDSRVPRFFFCPLPSTHESEGTLLELSDRSDKHPDASLRTEQNRKRKRKKSKADGQPGRKGKRSEKGTPRFSPSKIYFHPPGLRYSIDANGISVEKSTNKRNELMIINDKGRFSREDIRMNGERSGKISHRERETKGKGRG